MILTAVGMVKDEQDIIEPFVRHHMDLLDRMLLIDDSVDETSRILRSLVEEFKGRLEVERQEEFGVYQARRTTELLRRMAGADFVFPLDADEFIGTGSRDALELALMKVPLGGAGFMQWRTYVVTKDTLDACADDAPRGFCWRRKEEKPLYGKVVVHIAGCDVNDFSLCVGNHEAESKRGRMSVVNLDVPLLHFPVRSYEQLLGRTVTRWVACLSANPTVRGSGTSWHVQRNFDDLTNGSDMNVCEMSLMYAQDRRPSLVKESHCVEYERRYSDGKRMNALSLVAKAWEQSLISD